MGKTSASKQRHEGCLEGSEALKEVSQRSFSADGIADQRGQKIKRFIAPEAPSYGTDLRSEGIKHLLLRQVPSYDNDFSEPCGRLQGDQWEGCELQYNRQVS